MAETSASRFKIWSFVEKKVSNALKRISRLFIRFRFCSFLELRRKKMMKFVSTFFLQMDNSDTTYCGMIVLEVILKLNAVDFFSPLNKQRPF